MVGARGRVNTYISPLGGHGSSLGTWPRERAPLSRARPSVAMGGKAKAQSGVGATVRRGFATLPAVPPCQPTGVDPEEMDYERCHCGRLFGRLLVDLAVLLSLE